MKLDILVGIGARQLQELLGKMERLVRILFHVAEHRAHFVDTGFVLGQLDQRDHR